MYIIGNTGWIKSDSECKVGLGNSSILVLLLEIPFIFMFQY